jgi:hypothetical protein
MRRGERFLISSIYIADGIPGLRRPPPLNAKKPDRLYDSVGKAGSMYVVFENSQAYPEYVIYF